MLSLKDAAGNESAPSNEASGIPADTLAPLAPIWTFPSEGTVTGAAERLHLTQPAISHALRELESRLGVQLFRRTHRRMEPTVEGRRLLRGELPTR